MVGDHLGGWLPKVRALSAFIMTGVYLLTWAKTRDIKILLQGKNYDP